MRYFVNVTAKDAVLQDPGEGFSDLYEACTHAVELAAELFTQYPRKMKSRGAIVFRSPVG